jgi:hypothetical protein
MSRVTAVMRMTGRLLQFAAVMRMTGTSGASESGSSDFFTTVLLVCCFALACSSPSRYVYIYAGHVHSSLMYSKHVASTVVLVVPNGVYISNVLWMVSAPLDRWWPLASAHGHLIHQHLVYIL